MMIIYPDMGMSDREELLKNQCTKREMRNYSHSLDQSEIDVETKEYAQDGMLLQNTQDELDNIKKEYAAKIKNIEERMKERLEKIKFGKKTVSGFLYGLADHASGRMLFYDKFGELIESRDLLPDEKQRRLFIDQPQNNTDIPFENNAGGKPADPAEEQKIIDEIRPEFTPIKKDDPKYNKGTEDVEDAHLVDENEEAENPEQEQMDTDMPLTLEALKKASKKRQLNPDEQQLLQKLNADEKKAKRRGK